jgi:hypothetical protein
VVRTLTPFLAIALAFSACKQEDDEPIDTDIDGPSACGAEHTEPLVTITGKVTDGGAGVSGAEVQLEERNYVPGTMLGEATTNDDGVFVLEARDVVWVEDCWGTLFDWVLVADAGNKSGEKDVNSRMHGAITDGSFAFDMTTFPIAVE